MNRLTTYVSAPARLHFGLLSVGNLVDRQFGGLGLMVQAPRTELIFQHADVFSVNLMAKSGPSFKKNGSDHDSGSISKRCHDAAQKWLEYFRIAELAGGKLDSILSAAQIPVSVTLRSRPPQHSGLGSGTQLALAMAVGLCRTFNFPMPGIELSAGMGRAGRSAIGSYGFFQGGLLMDRGVGPHERVAPLDMQISFPESWPVVLAIPRVSSGMSGMAEARAFEKLPAVSPEKHAEMVKLARDEILPGVLSEDYDLFAKAIFEFGFESGMFYESVQGGPYNGRLVTELIESVREFGVPATGQSSWGPCVFAIARDHEQASRLQEHLNHQFATDVDVTITNADNRGVRIQSDVSEK